MGSCKNCGSWTKYHHNNGWCFTCFFFNYNAPRFWVSIVLTLIALNLPIMDGEGVISLMLEALFKETGFGLFFVGKIIVDLFLLIGSFFGISKLLYSLFKY